MALGRPVAEIFPELRQILEPQFAEVWAGGAVEGSDFPDPFVRATVLEDAWFDVSHSPVRGESGEVAGVLTILTETTGRVVAERRRDAAEAALREREQLLRNTLAELCQILDTAATGLTHLSRDLRYLMANAAYSKWIGLPPEKIIGRSIVDVMGQAAFDVIRPHVEKVLRGERAEYEADLPVGGELKPIHVVYTPDRDGAGDVVGWVASVTDIAERKRAEAALRECQERLRLAMSAAAAGAWMWNAVTDQANWDDRFNDMYGFEPDERRTYDAWITRLHPEDQPRVLSRFERMLKVSDDNNWNIQFPVILPDGRVAWMQGLGHAERDEAGKVTRIAGLNIDITERKLAEEVLASTNQVFEARVAERTRELVAHTLD